MKYIMINELTQKVGQVADLLGQLVSKVQEITTANNNVHRRLQRLEPTMTKLENADHILSPSEKEFLATRVDNTILSNLDKNEFDLTKK